MVCRGGIGMIKFFVEKENISGSAIYIDDMNDVKHLVKVLRAKKGDKILISDKTEWEYETEIETISKDEIKLKILDKQKMSAEPLTKVTLYQGIPKGSKMDSIIQKCVELGVEAIVPVFMERTVVTDKGGFHKKIERWQKISDEAVKQCKRGRIPEISKAIDYDEMLEDIGAGGYSLVLLPYEDEEGRTIKDALREYIACTRGVAAETSIQKCTEAGIAASKPEDKVAIIIGPEGGFDGSEIDKIKRIFNGSRIENIKSDSNVSESVNLKSISCGSETDNKKITSDSESDKKPKLEIVSLGKTILRTETAGQAALAMVMYELEL